MPAWWPGEPPCGPDPEPPVVWEVIRVTISAAAVRTRRKRLITMTVHNKTVSIGGVKHKRPIEPVEITREVVNTAQYHISPNSLVKLLEREEDGDSLDSANPASSEIEVGEET